MKSIPQRLEQQVHLLARKKVRSSVQPGTVWNVMENEMLAVLTDVLDQRLREEQQELLRRPRYRRGGDGRCRNGYKPLRLKGLFHSIVLRRPVLRGKTPPSALATMLSRVGHNLMAVVASRFWLRGTSTRAVAEELNETFGTKMSSCDVSHFTEKLLPDIEAWLHKPIDAPILYLFLDALYLPVRKPGFTSKQALLCAIAINQQGEKVVLGFLLGDRENADAWTALINDLLHRGMDRSQLQMVISDDHKAIVAAVEEKLAVPHQLCIIHKMRNTLPRVAARHRKEFYADFKAAFWAHSKHEALLALGALHQKWNRIYPKATQIACNKPQNFLRFMDQPQKIWTTLRSTNLIERFIRELRRRLRPAGTMHSEHELFKLVWSVSIQQEKRWLRRKLNYVKELKLAA